MDKEWSEKNKEMQALLKKEATFSAGIEKLIELRLSVFDQITQIVNGYPGEAFFAMPFAGADGYHSKTLAYSIWHIMRIEDIVAHELIEEDEQVLFAKGYDKSTRSTTIKTGNELDGNAIAEFSKQLDIEQLYSYARDVMESTNSILKSLKYNDLKRKFGDEYKAKLIKTGCISEDEKAFWLIDYWCDKDLRGLIQMPFSRHWIMHVEAMRRIKNKLCKIARKGIDPIAVCGFSCNHCFFAEWCGGCRTNYNVCSHATCCEDKICPNVKCCKEKCLDGCYDCDEILTCNKGFYDPTSDGAQAAKAQAMYIKKYGKKAFLKAMNLLSEKYDFYKTQQVLGYDCKKGLKILEEISGQ